MIKNLINKTGNFYKFLQSVENGENISVFGLGINEKIATIKSCDCFCLLVCATDSIALEFKRELEKVNLNTEVLLNLSGVNFLSTGENLKNLNNVLVKIENDALNCLIVTPQVLKQKLMPHEVFKKNFVYLEVGDSFGLNNLVQALSQSGMQRVDIISGQNEYSVHGDIVQVFLNGENEPIKISFFDDEIESISYYSLETFKNTSKVDGVLLPLGNLLSLTSDERQNAIKEINNLKLKFSSREQEDAWQKVKAGAILKLENESSLNNFFVPFLNNVTSSIFSYIPKNSQIIFNEPKQILAELQEFENSLNAEIKSYIADGTLAPNHLNTYISGANVFSECENFSMLAYQAITTANNIFKPQKVFSFVCLPKISYNKKFSLLADDCFRLSCKNVTVILYAKSVENAELIAGYLNRSKCSNYIIQNLNSVRFGAVNIVTKENNVSFGLLEENLVIIGTYDIFADKKRDIKKQSSNSFNQQFLPTINDFVVHEVHGVGKYLGNQKLNLGASEKEYALIEYKHGDKLYLPMENLNMVTKFVGSDKAPALNKLGGVDFAKTVAKVKAGVKELAFNLAKLYAERENKKPNVYVEDDEVIESFNSAFPYNETVDQLKAINDVKADMLGNKIMDRLICGDVGYGKTEVAMRAAFRCVASARQVAVLCPTTILSEQHYLTFVKRMQSFGVCVEVLNRFKTPLQQKEILSRVKDGKVDVLIGTHRLLSSDVEIPNLALLILDEEQRFGVADKEKIKTIKKNVDVLTLSATPIPRTLNLSLVGIRDISVIETPPENRVEPQVTVIDYSDVLIQNAITRELERQGQVLIVFNNVEHIYEFRAHVAKLVGNNVSIGVAHGQMNETQLENEIYKVYNNETSVLISTTLIENGVDLPNANTLIVINADKLGLSQLYQLKGRVGRSDRQAYAYFTFNRQKALTEDAYKRLAAIQEFSSFGSGFKIAMRDLEIRGAGSLLGANQHGHMEKVGYAMYVKLLKQAVDEMEGKAVEEINDVKISTSFAAYIPNNVVSKETERIALYSEISKLASVNALNSFLEKSANGYVAESVPISNLACVATIKNLAGKLGANEVSVNNTVSLKFGTNKLKTCTEIVALLNELNLNANLKLGAIITVNFSVEKDVLFETAKVLENVLIKLQNLSV